MRDLALSLSFSLSVCHRPLKFPHASAYPTLDAEQLTVKKKTDRFVKHVHIAQFSPVGNFSLSYAVAQCFGYACVPDFLCTSLA